MGVKRDIAGDTDAAAAEHEPALFRLPPLREEGSAPLGQRTRVRIHAVAF